jgi:hypothetical protein
VDRVRHLSLLQKSYWPGALALLALVGAVFWPVLEFDFVRWDDDINITQNPLLTMSWSWTMLERFLDSDQALRFKPLHWLCFRFLHWAFGFNPLGWHAFNLALHAAATVMFYLVLRQVLGLLGTGEGRERGAWAALAGAAVWALHPLRTEVVAWATASTYSLTAVCLLASFACYLEASCRPLHVRRWLGLAWMFAVMAYASYPVSVTYGLWLMAVDRWLLPGETAQAGRERGSLNLAWWVKHACFLVPAALAMGLTLWSRFMIPGMFTAAPTVDSVGLPDRVAMALASLTYFVGRLCWPGDLTPNMPPLVPSAGMVWQIVVFALVALLILILAWRERRRNPVLALVCFGFAALAVPCLGWTERPAWPVDRYSYIVHLVLIGGGAGWLAGWAGRTRALLLPSGLVAVALVLICAFAARRQAMIWRDSPALFTYMEQDPHFADNPRQQGHVYVMWASYEAAAARPERAAKLFNLAQQVYLSAIRAAVAQANYPEALALATHLEHHFTLTPVMHRERGAWLLRLARLPEALAELRSARQAMPDDPRIKSLLEEAEARAGQNPAGAAPPR